MAAATKRSSEPASSRVVAGLEKVALCQSLELHLAAQVLIMAGRVLEPEGCNWHKKSSAIENLGWLGRRLVPSQARRAIRKGLI